MEKPPKEELDELSKQFESEGRTLYSYDLLNDLGKNQGYTIINYHIVIVTFI